MSHSLDTSGESVNELNLSRYVQILGRHWRVIAAAGILGGLAALAYSVVLPAGYRSDAALAIVRTGLVLNMDARARTISDTDPNVQSVDQIAQRRSLLTIAQSQDVALAVIAALGTPPNEVQTPRQLASRVKVAMNSDVIEIQATMPTAEQATLLADTYARVLEERANLLLGETALPTEGLSLQAEQARQTYRDKEDALAAYLVTSQIEPLKRRVNIVSKEIDTRARVQTKMEQLEQDAQALQARLGSGETRGIPGTQLAQLLLEANAFNNETDISGNETDISGNKTDNSGNKTDTSPGALGSVQVNVLGGNVDNLTPAEQAQSLDHLVQAIRTRRQTLAAQDTQPLYDELRKSQSDLEQAQAKLRELQTERDVAWNAYQLLATKVSESRIASGYQNQIVRIISSGNAPSSSATSRALLNTLIGAALGVIVGAGLAFALEWLPFGKKREAQVKTKTAAENAAH